MKNREPDIMPCELYMVTLLRITIDFDKDIVVMRVCTICHEFDFSSTLTDDSTRVVLQSGDNDYINASHIGVRMVL